jgi:hypothetical protein
VVPVSQVDRQRVHPKQQDEEHKDGSRGKVAEFILRTGCPLVDLNGQRCEF